MIELKIQVFIEIGITYSSQHNQLPSSQELLTKHNQLVGVHVCGCVWV